MKPAFVVLIGFSLFCGGHLSYAQENPMPLSLKQCIDLALKNNIDVLLSRARAAQAKGRARVIDADLLPQIDAVASQERTWWENIAALGFSGFPGLSGVIGPYNTFNAQIMVSQRILDLSALAHAHAGKIKAQGAQLQIELASQEVTIATGLAYLQALGYAEELDSSYEDVRQAQHLLDLSLRQLNAGLATVVDVAGNRTQLAQQLARQEELRLNVIRSQLELKRLIKVPLSAPIELTDALKDQDHPYLNADEAVAKAMEDRMEVQVAAADLGYSREELKASEFGHLPTISLTGAWGETGSTPTQDVAHSANAMVSISLPIWEGGRIAAEIQENKGLNEEEKIKADDLNWKIEEDVRVALETLKSTRAQMEAFKKVENFARRELDLAQDRFAAGLGDNTQLIQAQVALADARDKYVQTLEQYAQAQLNYFGALGDPGQFDLSTK